MPPHDPPLILTLALASTAEAVFESERRRHFPEALNRVPAHVSLFHHLPGNEHESVVATLREAAARPGFPVLVSEPMSLGRGVAYRLRSETLAALRAGLATRWAGWLTPQDRQGFRPHLTIQNKVAPETARALHAGLMRGFMPYEVPATGLRLWRYLGGPWEAAGEFPFN